MAIISWSHSKLGDFESCKFKAWLKHDQRIPEPERPLPIGKTEHANDRGTRIHTGAELFVNNKGNFMLELGKFKPEFEKLKRLYTQGKVSLEGEWAHDKSWEIAPWKIGWLRLKLDALVHISKYEAVVIDFKSGKKFGNEIKHGEQTQLYALSTFLRFPELEEVTTELWYLDVNELTSVTYTRDQALRFKRSWDKRGHALTNCDVWPPNANKWSCTWCPYGKPENGFVNGTGHCSVGKK
jgi:CRISPR/Cas system-associated exonuclease Cas4 (RecB family)